MKSIDIKVYRGDTWNGQTYTMVLNGTPLDLTGAEVKIDLVEKSTDTLSKTLVSPTDIAINNPTTGVFVIKPTVMDVNAGIHLFDIQITLQDGTVKTWIKGTFNVIQDITDR